MNIIVRMRFGAHLYGTVTEKSDLDFKGVFLPSKEEIFLGRIPKSVNVSTGKKDEKNKPEDVDTEIYSLHYFLKLACQGETVAMDMLHAPESAILDSSPVWDEIVREKRRFHTKNLKAFVGYARRQAAKYGIKGSRLNAAKQIIDILLSINEEMRLSEIWDNLREDEHRHMLGPNPSGVREYQVCGRVLQETMTAGYAYSVVKKFYDAYGERARQAANNEGIDWKAVSHAFRAAYQVKELLTEGTITFPRPEADLLIRIKTGNIHYQREAAPMLDELISKIETLSEKSELPEKADRKFWDRFLIRTIERHIS